MTMRSPRHGGLYYPQDGPTLQDQIRAREGETAARPTALLLPHAAWPHILPLLHQTLAQARSLSPALIVLLAPHHGKRKNSALMISAASGLSLPHQEVPFARDAATALATRFSLQVDEEAFDDESSWELLVPLLSSYYPGVPILPILTGELSGSHRNNLTSLLKEIKKADPSTLFVVTANANPPLSSPSAEASARRFASSLEEGGEVEGESCNRSALSSLGSVLGGAWRIVGYMRGGTAYDAIPPSLDEQEKHVWHIGALLE